MKIDKIAYNPGTLLSMEEVLLFAKLADDRKNVESLWVPESWGREAFASLGALSQITKKVNLGTSIVGVYTRTPAAIAMAATTLDVLSNNRTILGLGVSTPSLVEDWHGTKFERPICRMREYIECLRLMMKGEKVYYSGTFFNVKNFKLSYKPKRQKIPIFVAAVNKHMISLGCDLADGILLYLRPMEELRKTVSLIKSRTRKKHKDFEIASVFMGAVSNKEPEKARERAAKTLAFYIAVGKYYNRFLSDNGFQIDVEQITSEYHRNGLDIASKFVSDKMLNSVTVSGNSEQCIRSVEKFLSAGISLPIIQVNPVGNTESSIREMLSTF